MFKEIWKDIPGYEGRYQVSSLGRVRSLDRTTKHKDGKITSHRGRVLKQQTNNKGYRMVSFSGGPRKSWAVHRLVLETFLPDRELHLHCNHIDGNKDNNCLTNLEWITNLENQRHAWASGLKNADHMRRNTIG